MVSYKDAGVDKEEGYKSVSMIKDMVAKTHNKNVLTGLGSFGAMYELANYKNPVLVSGTDGVGTKLQLAFATKKYDTVGIDCVAMCVNDILCHGAKPLFFLDYIACGKLDANVAAELVSGITKGCLDTGTALVGGETAEMPGFYKDGDYDIAGFSVGIVEKDNIINGQNISDGDCIIALQSSGVHSNGFSLVRKVVTDMNETLDGQKISDVLLTPTRLYVKSILALIEQVQVKGLAHITGGGLPENLPRILPNNVNANIQKSDIKILPVFDYLQSKGINETEMWGTFNMGVGLAFNAIIIDENHFTCFDIADKFTTDCINGTAFRCQDITIIGFTQT